MRALLLLMILPTLLGASPHTVRYRSRGETVPPQAEAPARPPELDLDTVVVGDSYWRGSGGAGPERPWTDRPVPPPPAVVNHVPQDWLSIGAGVFNVPQRRGVDSYRLEYISSVRIFKTGRVFGGLTTGPQSFRMGYAGFLWNFDLWGSGFRFLPSTSFGFKKDGPPDRFAGALQFRTAFELAYELDRNQRIGFVVQHISNAELDQPNLGANSQYLTYTVAMGR